MCAIKPSVHHRGWIKKDNWKICVHLCTAQSHPCSCPSGGLVSIDLCGWWGLTSLPHLAQQCPFKSVHLQQGACCSATLLHPASLFDKRPRLGLRWGVGVGPPTPPPTPPKYPLLPVDRLTHRADVKSEIPEQWLHTLHHGPVGSAVHRSPPPWKATSTSLCLIIDNSTGWCVRLAFTVITFGYRVSATQLEHTGDPDNSEFGKLKIRSFVLVCVFF